MLCTVVYRAVIEILMAHTAICPSAIRMMMIGMMMMLIMITYSDNFFTIHKVCLRASKGLAKKSPWDIKFRRTILCQNIPPQHEKTYGGLRPKYINFTRGILAVKGQKTRLFHLFIDIDVSPVGACGEFFLFSGKIWWHFQHQSHGYFINALATCSGDKNPPKHHPLQQILMLNYQEKNRI